MSLLITGGRIIDPTRRTSWRRSRGGRGRSCDVGDGLVPAARRSGDRCVGLVVSPGFVDLHVHLREPGREEAETIETGSRAAALGGFTAVVAMPNTDPTQDCVEVVDFVRRQGERAGLCEVLPAGSITVGRAGRAARPVRRARSRRRQAVHRRRQRRAGSAPHAPGARVRRRSRDHARPALRGRTAHGGRGDARGRLLQPVRSAGLAVDRRGADGASRHRTRPTDGRADALPAPVDRRQRRAGASAPRPTACRSRPRRHRTTSA